MLTNSLRVQTTMVGTVQQQKYEPSSHIHSQEAESSKHRCSASGLFMQSRIEPIPGNGAPHVQCGSSLLLSFLMVAAFYTMAILISN